MGPTLIHRPQASPDFYIFNEFPEDDEASGPGSDCEKFRSAETLALPLLCKALGNLLEPLSTPFLAEGPEDEPGEPVLSNTSSDLFYSN